MLLCFGASFPEDWHPTKGGHSKGTKTLEDISNFKRRQSFKHAAASLTVQEANLWPLARQELQAQGGAVRQHDKPTAGRLPTHIPHRKQRWQLRWPIFLENGPQLAAAELPEWAEPLHGCLATAKAAALEPGRGRGFREPRLARWPPTGGTEEEREVQLHATTGQPGGNWRNGKWGRRFHIDAQVWMQQPDVRQ